MPASHSETLVDFYRGEHTDDRGRILADILKWNHERLEETHDYIQWLFPLTERSSANFSAPILDAEQIKAFQDDAGLQRQLVAALAVMLDFYGLKYDATQASPRIIKSDRYATRCQVWLTPNNHNFLRITRIIKCLSLLGLPDHASALYECMGCIFAENRETIGRRTFEFWRDAAKSRRQF